MANLTNTKASAPKVGTILFKNFTNKNGAQFAQQVVVAGTDKILTRGEQARQVAGFKKAFGGSAPASAIVDAVGNPDEFISMCFVTSKAGQRFSLVELATEAVGTVI